jgi:hypothetical protein
LHLVGSILECYKKTFQKMLLYFQNRETCFLVCWACFHLLTETNCWSSCFNSGIIPSYFWMYLLTLYYPIKFTALLGFLIDLSIVGVHIHNTWFKLFRFMLLNIYYQCEFYTFVFCLCLRLLLTCLLHLKSLCLCF